jgi:hypothetical protein
MPLNICSYIRRRNSVRSFENIAKPYILSMIIDIADQQNCQIPWKGTQDSFQNPLRQLMVGVKEHGYGVHLFPTIDTVKKGANLTIHVIDSVIEMWTKRHGYYPTVIYLQVDGGEKMQTNLFCIILST